MFDDAPRKIQWRYAGVVVLISLVISFIFLAKTGYKLAPDSMGYIRVAKNLLEHGALLENDYVPGVLIHYTERMPAYPVLLAGLFRIFGQESNALIAAAFLNSIFLGISAFAVFILASNFFSERIGLIAGLLAAVDPWSKLLSVMILTDSMFYMATTVALCCGVYAITRSVPRKAHFFFFGLTIGLASMVRPVLLYFWIGFLPLVFFRYEVKKRLYLFAVFFVGFFLIIGGWLYRNHSVAGFWGLQTSDGISILWSNYELTRPSTNKDYELNSRLAKARDIIANADNPIKVMTKIRKEGELSPVELNGLFREIGLENIRENPVMVSLIYGQNFIKTISTMFSTEDDSGVDSQFPAYIVWGEKTVSFICFLVMPIAGAILAWRKWSRKVVIIFFALFGFYILLLSSLVAGSFRYRFPVHGIFWILDAVVIGSIFDYYFNIFVLPKVGAARVGQ